MLGFGRYNPFPVKLGGGVSILQVEHAALRDALADGYDPADETASSAELYGYAVATAVIWRLNGRLTNQALPERMLENLTTWEQACGTRPTASDTVQDRRARVAAKLRGLADNTLSGLYDACRKLLGAAFVELRTVAPAKEIVYWPGVNPGPPGFEWSSNRATIAVVVRRLGLGDVEFRALVQRAYQMLDGMAAAPLTFQVGTAEGGFVVGKGIVGLTLL